MAHEAQDFLNPFYFKKIICEDEFYSFIDALKNYRANLQSNANQNEDSLVANALKPFFEALWFQAEAKHKQKGNSEIDLALKKDSAVSVIIEAKKPKSKEIPSAENPNAKALHEAILYYFREREMGNLGIKSIVITDFYRFFIIKSRAFESVFYENPAFKKLYENFTAPNSLFKGNTDEFYNESKRILDLSEIELNYFCIDLARIFDENDFSFPSIKPIFKVLNREFLLDEFSPNDANVLNERFYRELLYIMGLDEFKEGKNILIKPSKESKIEQNTLYKCILDKLPSENRNFDFAMQFVILWLNRILFLKLVEANLVRFNADKNLKFLHLSKVIDFKTLSNLFFEILAKMPDERKDSPLSFLPYLNSSLFERHKCEETLDISALDDNAKLAYFNETQLKDKFAKKKQGDVGLLAYIFEFLDAFDFGSDEGSGELATQKELISSSVLGLVFEKLNGYKEGSFFTPSFITGYMCKQSIRKIVLQKFNENGYKAQNLTALRNEIDINKLNEANKIFLSIHICDPAVGSGHFLVSALNELIAIKHELGLLLDCDGKRLRDIDLALENDELIIKDSSGKIIDYTIPAHERIESHIIQKAIFYTKREIIEHCLFGVDINPSSVEICKLRLWIELLKYSYYENIATREIQTLPNIDINIKCGNSLISRFKLDNSLPTTQNIKNQISEYKKLVFDYKNADQNISTTKKSDIVAKIYAIKQTFRLTLKDPKTKRELENAIKKHTALYGLFMLDDESLLDGLDSGISNTFISANLSEAEQKDAVTSFANIKFLHHKLDSNGNGYKNAFEWRFEFPEVLNENGDFIGFDLVIGNPPYISTLDLTKSDRQNKDIYNKKYPNLNGLYDIYVLFVLLGLNIRAKNGSFGWIIPNKFLIAEYAKQTFNILLENKLLEKCVDVSNVNTFERASVYPIVILGNNNATFEKFYIESQDDLLANNLKQEHYIDWNRFKTFADFGIKIQSGLAGFQAHSIVKFLTTKKKKGAIPFAVSGSIDRYSIDTNKVTYMRQIYKNPYIAPNNAVSINKWNFWKNEKIIIAGMTKKLESCYVKTPLAIGVGIYAIYDFAGLNPLLLLGVLNSKFMNYVFVNKFKDKHLAGGYLGINKNNLDTLPIFEPNAKNQKIADKIINLVDKILESKAQGKETSALESQVDDLVYELYNLNDSEIKIIEKT